MDFVLLVIELKKLAGRSLRLAASFILPLAILNLSLGATIMLATPPGFVSLAGAAGGQQVELVHMQMFGGLIHLHDGSGPDHSHSQSASLPEGVTEQEYIPAAPQIMPGWSLSITGNHFMALNSSDSAANFWQDLTTRGQADPETLANYQLALTGREIPAVVQQPPNPFLAVPLKPPIL
jgi:hypothetical protein